jgi:hypothetical protein
LKNAACRVRRGFCFVCILPPPQCERNGPGPFRTHRLYYNLLEFRWPRSCKGKVAGGVDAFIERVVAQSPALRSRPAAELRATSGLAAGVCAGSIRLRAAKPGALSASLRERNVSVVSGNDAQTGGGKKRRPHPRTRGFVASAGAVHACTREVPSRTTRPLFGLAVHKRQDKLSVEV